MPSMPQPIPDDQDDTSEAEEIVQGVDTHKDRHAAAVLSTLGVLLEQQRFSRHRSGISGVAGLGGHVRDTATGWCGGHRLLRRGAGPLPAGSRC